MARRVLILSYHFYPSAAVGAKRVSELALALAAAGWTVTAVAAPPDREEGVDAGLGEWVRTLDVRRVPAPPKLLPRLLALRRHLRPRVAPAAAAAAPGATPRSASPLRTAKRYFLSLELLFDANKIWLLLVLLRLLTLRPGHRFDLVLSSGPPMSTHLAGRFAKGLFGARWVVDLRDPWIGNAMDPPEARSRLKTRLEEAAERRCLHAADLVVCASPGVVARIEGRHPDLPRSLEVVYNGYDGEPAPPCIRPRGRLSFLYAGTLYFNRNPFPFLEALKAACVRPEVDPGRVTFTLVGHCQAWGGRRLADWVAENHMEEQVRVLPPVGFRELPALVAEADVLVNLAQGQPDQIPAKVFEYIGWGREILTIAEVDSDTARLVRRTGCGRVVEPDDREGLAAAVRDLYRRYVVEGVAYEPDRALIAGCSRAAQTRRYLDLIDTVCAAPAAEAAPGRRETG